MLSIYKNGQLITEVWGEIGMWTRRDLLNWFPPGEYQWVVSD